jgi:hypothetical protein
VRNPIRLGDLSQKHPIRNGRRCLVYTLAGKKFSTSPQFCKQLVRMRKFFLQQYLPKATPTSDEVLKSLLFRATKTARGAYRLRSSYDDGPQGGIVARLDVKSDVLTWPSALPSSSMSTPDQAPDCTRILTLAFRGTRMSDLQP